MYVQGSSGYGSRYPYAPKGAVRQRHGVDAQKTPCRWCINRPEPRGSISAKHWNGNPTPEEQNEISLCFLAVWHIFFICTTRKYRVFSTPELGMEMTELLRHNVLLSRNWIFTMFCLCPNR